MSLRTREKFYDVSKWYFEHQNDGRSIDKEVKFLKKTCECLLAALAEAVNDINELEGRPKESLGSPLFRPGKLSITGDLTRLG